MAEIHGCETLRFFAFTSFNLPNASSGVLLHTLQMQPLMLTGTVSDLVLVTYSFARTHSCSQRVRFKHCDFWRPTYAWTMIVGLISLVITMIR